jgi:hypothetical protein
LTNLGGHFLSPVWIFPLLFWMVNQIKINNVSKYLLLSDFIFFQVSNIKIWNIGKYQKFITSCVGIYKYQSYHEFFENLEKRKQTKTWYLLTLFILIWFTHQKRRGKRTKNVPQGLSKVFVFFTYSTYPRNFWLIFIRICQRKHFLLLSHANQSKSLELQG